MTTQSAGKAVAITQALAAMGAVFLLPLVPASAAEPDGRLPASIHVTLVDEPVMHYATFQSHNQKVVEHNGVMYMTHLRTRNPEYTDQSWRLSYSTDGGATFAILCEESAATNPPVIELDDEGNLYLFRVDFISQDAYLDRWPAGAPRVASSRITTRIPTGAAGKYAAAIDVPRQQLYFFSHNNTFHRLKLNGQLIDSRTLLAPGPNAILQYPLLSLSPDGRLHLAWTTQKHGQYLYWDIHHAFSDDGGTTFASWPVDGQSTSTNLTLPIVADDTGPTSRISLDDEFTAHTWLASSLATKDHWHGLYLAQTNPQRQHYMRYDAHTGARQRDMQPEVRGQELSLKGLDGYLVADRHHSQRLYVVGNNAGRLACLVSQDSGDSWNDYAVSHQSYGLYSIGGFRCTTSDGAIIGSFTDQQAPEELTDRKSRVFFFRIALTDK
ncbi:MAG: hypothetical protein KF752_16630 [Pirellulaceae bacterium]|nr:hypothetical protein [Pirellulaceae bacterium]